MATATYKRFREAMTNRKQIVCIYDGKRREICSVILGHTRGEEAALTFQFGGESGSGLPREGEWRCLYLAKVRNVRLRDGPWRSGSEHGHRQACVEEVDLDVNPNSPYRRRQRSG